MSEITIIPGGVCAAQGYQAHAIECGVKDPKNPRLDMGLIYSPTETTSAAAFTTNQVCAAPVKLSKAHLAEANFRAFLVNSGNANACTGEQGLTDAQTHTAQLAEELGLQPNQIAVCSTGVIGLPLPAERMSAQLPALASGLHASTAQADLFAKAIMTSDTRQKEIAVEVELGGKKVRIGGCSKGAGMIKPSMATMLCFLTTDAAIPKDLLQEAVIEATNASFNRISVDGDMSTNDTVLLMANGLSGAEVTDLESDEGVVFRSALTYVMDYLAKAIVLDGEKVTKFVTVHVLNARTEEDAQHVAEAVANSPLVKSSWNGDDPNWGRVIHAVGYAKAHIQEDLIDILWEDQLACEGGKLGPAHISKLREIASKDAFELIIDLKLGEASYKMYTSDLSPEYVDYNRSEYSYWKAVERNQG